MSKIKDAADALKTFLEAQSYTLATTKNFESLFVAETKKEALTEATIEIIVKPIRREGISRGRGGMIGDTQTFGVMVLTKCKPQDTTRIDELLEFVDEMQEFFAGNEVGFAGSTYDGTELINNPIYDDGRLRNDGIFQSVTELNLFVERRKP